MRCGVCVRCHTPIDVSVSEENVIVKHVQWQQRDCGLERPLARLGGCFLEQHLANPATLA